MPKYVEPKRGCGYRTVGKLYLVGGGIPWPCPGLPLYLKECELCGYQPTQYRDFTWMSKQYLYSIKEPTGRACHKECPICYPSQNTQEKYGLMWVGKRWYTPQSFIKESAQVGVSKAIKQIPKGLILGKTWVMVAHPKTPNPKDEGYIVKIHKWAEKGALKPKTEPPQPPGVPGVFYAFIPEAIELLIYKKDATPEKILELEKKGITPIIIPNNADGHRVRARKYKSRSNRA